MRSDFHLSVSEDLDKRLVIGALGRVATLVSGKFVVIVASC